MYYWVTHTIFPLYRITIVVFQLWYRTGFLFLLNYSLISMTISSGSNCNHWLIKVKHPVTFMFFRVLSFFSCQLTHINQKQASVLLARNILRSALKVGFTRFVTGKSYKQLQFKIFQTSWTELQKKRKIYLEKNSFTQRSAHDFAYDTYSFV